MSLVQEFQRRGLLQDVTCPEELDQLFARERVPYYCGFDPTADSLHVGSMLPLLMMRRLQESGHKPILVLGSATGMIGDPSGKSEERKLLSEEIIAHNLEGIRKQASRFLQFDGKNACIIVKNGDWLNGITLIEFLRDVGKHFSVNAMMAKESVRGRLEEREQGISYTEFSYMLLQAYDFYWLYKGHQCKLQIGGSDQWGNITAGIDLIRRKLGAAAYGLTFPLITSSSGNKFGKTEQGNVWLDAKRTSPYRFYQFWMNTPDADVIRYLNLFTTLPIEQIQALENTLREKPEDRAPQRTLAETLTVFVHGEEESAKARQASAVLFGGDLKNIDSSTLQDIFADVPSTEIARAEFSGGIALQDLLVRCKLADSKGAARRLIENGGIYLNNERVNETGKQVSNADLLQSALLILRSGKRNYCLVRATD